ncbi:MAG: hypothetical protein HY560_05590 [Gemmatimonadetes bacterium]|nr:hypothetical protein [Gemmatimonadota bacterium]
MSAPLPSGPMGPRLDRAVIERVIQRAAELQASEKDFGEGLTEKELYGLAGEVGIPESFLRQALLEERTRSVAPPERGLAAWLAGPRLVAAARAMAGEHHRLEAALHQWMGDGELLSIKRRYPDQTSWEPKQGAMATLRRAFGFGGRGYVLTRAREVVGQVVGLDPGRCHVALTADLSNTRNDRLAGAGAILLVGALASAIGLVLGVASWVAALPAALGILAGVLVARGRRRETDRVQVALEQILDRLEHGEVEVQKQFRGPRQSAFVRIADELLKTLGPHEEEKGK